MSDPTECLNCGTALAGPWCHACGQRAEAHARSLRHIVLEWLELLTHADGRVWRTLRRLAVSPSSLSRDYIAGRRASEIAPLRIFFIALVLLFALGSIGSHGQATVPYDRVAVDAWIGGLGLPASIAGWMKVHLRLAASDPRPALAVMGQWAERLAFLMLPIATGLLCVLFGAIRGSRPYDHAVVALHSLSFSVLVLALYSLLDDALGGVAMLLLLVLPVHLFAHLRGVYATSVAGTLARMAMFAVGSLFGGSLILAVVTSLGLAFAGGS